MDLESDMCRQPVAWMFNHVVPGATWLTEANYGNNMYESGRPDAIAMPWMLPVECKADKGSLYTGNPESDATVGFHKAQRNWLDKVCRKPGAYIPFYMALWMNPIREGRIKHTLDRLFLVNVDVWLDMEYVAVTHFGTRSIPLNDTTTNFKYRKELNVERWFGAYALDQYQRINEKGERTIAWKIPNNHPVWDDLRRHQMNLLENIEYLTKVTSE